MVQSISLIVSGLLQLILMNYTIIKGLFEINKHVIKDIIKISMSSAILAVILSLIKVYLWIDVSIGLVVYLIAIIITRTLDEQDIHIIKELFGK